MKFRLWLILLITGIALQQEVKGQNPLAQANLFNLKSEQVTDQQLMDFVTKAKSSGLSEDQIITMAQNRGMAGPEIALLKERIGKLQITSEPGAVLANPSSNVNPDISDKSANAGSSLPPPPAASNASSGPAPMVSTDIYGHSFFKNNSFQTYEKGADAKAPDSYVVGSGDEFAISVFGFSMYNEVVKVDQNGYIKMNGIGQLNVKGITFGKAKNLIKSKLGGSFDLQNNQVTIVLSYSRIITINIVGEVDKPGSYKMPAANTAFNALISVGGPGQMGTVRNIQIRRAGKVIKVLDIYEFLASSNANSNYFLEDNDFIFIPQAGKIVSIVGEVKRPMRYEMLPKEDLDDLIKHAGGFTTKAYKQLFSVNRLNDDGKHLNLLSLSYDSLSAGKKHFALKDGDAIAFNGKSSDLTEFVEVRGAVYLPGQFEFKSTDRLSDLIGKSNGFKLDARLDKGYLIRIKSDLTREYIPISLEFIKSGDLKSSDNLLVQKGDVLLVFSINDTKDPKTVSIGGYLRKPGVFEYYDGMRLSDLLTLSSGLKEGANAKTVFLNRMRPDFTREFVTIDLEQALLHPEDTTKNIALRSQDGITVLSTLDFIDKMEVNSMGLLRKPGNFQYIKGMTLGDIVLLSGGMKMEADPLRIEVSRLTFFTNEYKPGDPARVTIKSFKVEKGGQMTPEALNFMLNPFDQVFVRMIPDFELPKNLTVNGEVIYPGIYAIASKDERISDIVARAGGLNRFAYAEGATLFRPSLPGGYIVMNLKDAVKHPKSKFNYIIREGDVINIPRILDFVAITGSVQILSINNNPQVNAPYTQGKRANYYIHEYCNGFNKESWRKKTYVIENSTKVTRTKNFILFKIYPKVHKGSVIHVIDKPIKVEKKKEASEPINYNRMIENLTVKITGLLTLYILAKTVAAN